MKKKIITALLAAIIAVSFASCGIVRGTPAETSGAVKSKDTSSRKSDLHKNPRHIGAEGGRGRADTQR